VQDGAVVLDHAQRMLTWRSRHADRALSDMLLSETMLGRLPDVVE
jgi:hypothetical protein